MAQKGLEDPFSCYICFDLLEDPVTIPCGHTCCRRCITSLWDRQPVPSCPQCLQSFSPCPPLMKNAILGVLVEQLRRRALLDPVDCSAGAEDVACDSCIGVKMKAIRSCLVCLVSYCRWHLQPHFQSPAFEKHKLVEPRETLQENFCSQHNEAVKMFCRTDQQLICNMCYMDAHKGHDTASTLMERTERQKVLIEIQKEVERRVREKEKDFLALKEEVEVVNRSADRAVEDIDRFFHEMFQLLERKHSEKREQIEAVRDVEMSHASKLNEKLQQEIEELTRANHQLEELFLSEDHTHFLHSSSSLLHLAEPAAPPATEGRHPKHVENATAGWSHVQQKIQNLCENWPDGSDTDALMAADVPTSPQPQRRADFLKYSCNLTLDPKTAHPMIVVTEGNRRATYVSQAQPCLSNPERFLYCYQALSKERMAGRCYWEVSVKGGLHVALSYRSIRRGLYFDGSGFGFNPNSWALQCDKGNYVFHHDKVPTPFVGEGASRVGVYLDHSAGLLSFYSVSHTMTLLHRVQTAFAQPLHAGIRFSGNAGDEAEFTALKKVG